MEISSLHQQLFGSSRILTLGQVFAALASFSKEEASYVYCSRNLKKDLDFGLLYERGCELQHAVRDEYMREEKRAEVGLKVPRGFYISDLQHYRDEVFGLVPYVEIEYRGRFESLRGLTYEVFWLPGRKRSEAFSLPKKGYKYPWWLKS